MQLVVADVESTIDSESEHGGRDDADIEKDKRIIKGATISYYFTKLVCKL